MNIRVTSSALIGFIPPCAALPGFHPNRGRGWKLAGEATAVICDVCVEEEFPLTVRDLQLIGCNPCKFAILEAMS